MFSYRDRTALVTGASSGIGAEFARQLAACGMNLVLVARNQQAMETLASEIRNRHSVDVQVIVADLSREVAVTEIQSAVTERGLQIHLLVNNAGVMTYGPFEEINPADDHSEIMVNVASLVGLTHAFLPDMLKRQEGGVINIASVAGFQPIPYLAVYSATKAFVIAFSVALWEECRSRKVSVLGMCPGTTSTELFVRGNAKEAAVGTSRSVEQVVTTALRGLDQKRSLIVDGFKNTLLTYGPRLIPKWFAASCAAKAVRPQNERA